jgi:hypothetical protein
MAGIFTAGGNPFAADPLALLSTAAQPGQDTPPVQAPMAPAFADPQTTGTVAPPSNGAAPAAPAEDNRGIMDRLGDAFSGRAPLFGSAPTDDNEIDPMTGAPKGLVRQSNMRSMMQLGLTFLLAGQRMSSDQRAAILSKAPGLIGGGDDSLNSFAKTRLEMAKLRMEQQKMQQDQQSQQAIMQALGVGGGTAAAPSAGAQGVQAGQQALAQAAPVVAPGLATPDANAAPGGGIPANAATDYQSPQAPAPDPAPAPTPAPAAIAAPGGVPRQAMGGPVQQATSSADDPKNWTATEKLAILAQPTTAGKATALQQIQQARAAGVRTGAEQYDDATGKLYAPQYDGRGNMTGRLDLGTPRQTTRDTDKYREEGYIHPITKEFQVTKRTDLQEDPGTARMSRAEIEGATKDRDTLKETYEKTIQPGLQTYDKMAKIRADVEAGKGVFGTGADLRMQAYNALATLGYNFDGKLTGDMNVTANFQRVMKNGIASVIKDFNGNQNVSDRDVKLAQEVMQSAASGNREAVKNALDNAMADIRGNVERYNSNAKSHNSLLDGSFEGNLKKRYTVPTIDRDLSPAQQRAQEAQGQPDAAGAPKPAPVVRYERRDGKIVRVQD